VAMWWKDLGGFTEWPAGSKETIVAGVTGETDGRTVDELAQMRDQVLLELVKIRTKQVEATAPAAVR